MKKLNVVKFHKILQKIVKKINNENISRIKVYNFKNRKVLNRARLNFKKDQYNLSFIIISCDNKLLKMQLSSRKVFGKLLV